LKFAFQGEIKYDDKLTEEDGVYIQVEFYFFNWPMKICSGHVILGGSFIYLVLWSAPASSYQPFTENVNIHGRHV